MLGFTVILDKTVTDSPLHCVCRFVCVSHSGPEDRLHILAAPELAWRLIEHTELPKNKLMFHAYVFEKR